MKRFRLAAVLALAGAFAFSASADAQTDPNVFPMDMNSHVLKGLMLDNVLSNRGRRAPPPRPPQRAIGAQVFAAPASVAVAPASASTAYRASPAVSARVKQQYVDYVRKQAGPQAAQQYSAVLAKNDHVRNWAQLVAEEGFRPGDVAEALASYWMLNYLIANGLVDPPGGAGAGRIVAQQVRGIMAGNPAFSRLNEAQRQEMAEVFMLNFLSQQAAYSNAVKARDAGLKRRLGDAAVTRFRNEMGVDLRQLELTNQGFVKRG